MDPRTKQDLGALALLALLVALFWLYRRFVPPVTCPRCGSGNWIFAGDDKECRDCGHFFYF